MQRLSCSWHFWSEMNSPDQLIIVLIIVLIIAIIAVKWLETEVFYLDERSGGIRIIYVDCNLPRNIVECVVLIKTDNAGVSASKYWE